MTSTSASPPCHTKEKSGNSQGPHVSTQSPLTVPRHPVSNSLVIETRLASLSGLHCLSSKYCTNDSRTHASADTAMAPSSYPSPTLLGCRKSELALIQARYVIAQIEKLAEPPKIEISTGTAAGDKDKITPFLELSKQTGGSDVGKSLWTNELEADLVAGKVHFLVHSLKDMPTTLPPNCLLGAITEREDTSDAVVMPKGSKYKTIDELPAGSVVGSSSSRRRALIRKNWPHLEVEECRGNV